MSEVTEQEWRETISDRINLVAERLAFADWLEERGRCMEANGQRWQAKHRRRPMYGWWWDEATSDGITDTPSDLPTLIFDALPEGLNAKYMQVRRYRYGSDAAAELALAEALFKLGIQA